MTNTALTNVITSLTNLIAVDLGLSPHAHKLYQRLSSELTDKRQVLILNSINDSLHNGYNKAAAGALVALTNTLPAPIPVYKSE